MHYILHIDTSTDASCIAVGGDGTLLAVRNNEETRNHAGTINNMINDVLGDAGILIAELSAIAVCAGPGSYTGLRIGMATAKGICYAADKSLIADDRLTLMALQAYKKHANEYTQYISLLVAREKEYFISIFDNNFKCTLPPQHIMEEQLAQFINNKAKTYVITNALQENIEELKINDLLIDTDTKIDPQLWVLHAFKKYNCNGIVTLSSAEPIYLKQVYTHK